MEIVLKQVRLAFADIYTPRRRKADDKEARYSAVLIIEPGSANDELIRKTISEVVAKFAADNKLDPKAVLDKIKSDPKNFCYLMRDRTDKNGKVYDGFEGMFSLSTGQSENRSAPLVVDQYLRPVQQGAPNAPYSGAYVNAKVDIWLQNNEHGRAVRSTLRVVQFARDGDAFGAGAPPTVDGMEPLGEPDEGSKAGSIGLL